MKKKRGAVALFVLTAITFYEIRDAYGELVFEEDLSPSIQNEVKAPKENSQDIISAEDESFSETSEVETDKPVLKSKTARHDYSRSESMRRQRMREELRNEDKLTEKLEELRLKDEMKRVTSLLGSGIDKSSSEKELKPEALSEERVGSAAIQPSELKSGIGVPLNSTNVSALSGPSGASQIAADGQSVAQLELKKGKEDEDSFNEHRISIMPRGGISSISDSKFEISSKYSLGLTVGVDVSDYFTVEGGYTYAAYNLSAGNTFYSGYGYYGPTFQTLNMTQSVIDLGVRVNVLGNKYRVRPFVSGGLGYYRSSVNLDDRTLAMVKQYSPTLATDYVVSGFTGYVGTGVEFRVTKAVSLTGMFKYYNILTATQSNPISGAAFVNPNNAQAYSYAYNDPRMQASQFLSKNNFFTVMAGVSLSF